VKKPGIAPKPLLKRQRTERRPREDREVRPLGEGGRFSRKVETRKKTFSIGTGWERKMNIKPTEQE